MVWFYLLCWLVFCVVPLWMAYRGAGPILVALVLDVVLTVFYVIAALSGVQATLIVTGAMVVLAWAWIGRHRKRWKRIAAQLGLKFERMERGWRIFGLQDGTPVEARYSPVGMTYGTVVEATFPDQHAGVSLEKRGFGGRSGWTTGDEDFDTAVLTGGRRDLGLAVLGPDVREQLRRRLKDVVIAEQHATWTHSRLTSSELVGRLGELSGFVRSLTITEAQRAERLQVRLTSEPLREVRHAIVEAVVPLLPDAPELATVLETAKQHEDAATAVRAAALTDDVALLEAFADHADPGVLREARSALVRLGKRTDAGAGGMVLVDEGQGGEVSLAEELGGLALEATEGAETAS